MALDEDAEEEQFSDDEENNDDAEDSEKEEDIYDEDSREKQEDQDEISPTEEAFMEGYDDEESVVECTRCKKSLLKIKSTVERQFKGRHFRFCSEKCANDFKFPKSK
jgi:hypothetical protein